MDFQTDHKIIFHIHLLPFLNGTHSPDSYRDAKYANTNYKYNPLRTLRLMDFGFLHTRVNSGLDQTEPALEGFIIFA